MPGILQGHVTIKRRGDMDFRKLENMVRDLADQYVAIGILEATRSYPDSTATLGEVAMTQEFGTETAKGTVAIPSRSFLRTPVDKAIETLVALQETLLNRVFDEKMTVPKALGRMGAEVVRIMQTAIVKRIDPPLRPLTLQLRKERGITGTIPLLATRWLYQNIHFAVRKITGSADK